MASLSGELIFRTRNAVCDQLNVTCSDCVVVIAPSVIVTYTTTVPA
jgi:hypothetical protein